MNFLKVAASVLSTTLILASCSVPKPLTRTQGGQRLPNQFQGFNNTDTVTTGNKPYQLFFTDVALKRLIDTAILQNLELRSAAERLKMAEAVLSVSQALTQPSLQATLNAQVDRYGFYTMNGVGNYDLNKSNNITLKQRIPNPVPDLLLGLRSQWEIDVWGKLRSMKRAAQARYLATEKGLQMLQTQVVASVAYLYYEILGLTYELEVVRKNAALQDNALEIVRAQKEGGRATELAVKQFAAQVYRTQAVEFEVRQQIAEAENRLNVILGRYPTKIELGSGLLDAPMPELIKAGVPSELIYHRPDLMQSALELSAAFEDVEVARASFLPSFIISPGIGFNSFRPGALFNGQSIAATLGGNITAPLFMQRRIRGQYTIATAAQRTALIAFDRNLQVAVMEAQTSLQAIANLDRQISLKQQEFDELSAAVLTANDLYANGYANYLEVITAQQTLLDAEIKVTLLRKSSLQALVSTYRALGGGWR